MKNAIIFSLLVVIALLSLAQREAKPVNDGLPLVHADFPSCVTVHVAPLLRTPSGRLDYRLGKPSNDRGET